MNRYIFILPFLFSSIVLSGQSMKAYENAGEQALADNDFYNALVYFMNASEFDSTRLYIQYKVAESARLFNAYEIAREKYQYVIDNETDSEFPLATFWLGDIQQKLGNFEEAKMYFELYLSEREGEDPYYTNKAKKEIRACDWFINLINNPDQSVEIKRLGEGINTIYSEFGALKFDNDLYYSSLKFEDPTPEQKPVKIYSKILKSPDLIISDTISGGINIDGRHVAHTTFSPGNDRIYYTICDYDKGLEIRCDIYMRPVLGDGFGNEIKLPETINDPMFTNTQPNCTMDSLLGKEVLYFVSDRQEGKGKLDIWYSIIEEGRVYSEPKNLETINTPENDITPFYHQLSHTLYFSSEGYRRLGGYDIYRSQQTQDGFVQPDHMQVPYNSSYHDLYFTLSDDKTTAYFSSNRPGSLYIDESREACCYDIYEATIQPVTISLNAQTFDQTTQNALPGATVRIIDTHTGQLVDKVSNLQGNDHLFTLEKDKIYHVIGDKTPYISDTIMVSTKQIFESQQIVRKLFLELEQIVLDVFTFDEETQEVLTGVTVTLMDLTDNSVQDVTLQNAQSNDFQFLLKPGRTYKITATKPDDYKATSIIVDTSIETGDGHLTKNIYLARRDLNIYLPLTLYFDNDRPDRKSWSRTTRIVYTESYQPYLTRKNYYKNNTAIGLQGENRILEVQRMDDFFEFDVKGGYEKLHLFMNAVLNELKDGHSFEIRIKGFASPLATSEYNKRLGQRRVSSVQNEISKYIGGALKPFIDSGQLRITDVSFGEDLAPTNVSDSRTDLRSSIYSVGASKERRVEIIEIKNTDE